MSRDICNCKCFQWCWANKTLYINVILLLWHWDMSLIRMFVSNFATVYFVSIIETMKTSVYSPHYDKLRLWLKAHREERSLSLRDVSEKWGKHHSILGKIEQARRKIELVEFLELCQILEVDPLEGLSVIMKSMNTNHNTSRPWTFLLPINIS